MILSDSEAREVPLTYRVCLPSNDGHLWEWHKLPEDVYDSKPRPTCRCGRRYVPVDSKRMCFFCSFTRKTDKKEFKRIKNVLPTPPKILRESYILGQHKPTDNARMSREEIDLILSKRACQR